MKGFKEHLEQQIANQKAIDEAQEQMAKAKDAILERMTGIYFRVEQLRYVKGSSVTVAEVVNKMPRTMGQFVDALRFAWTQDYMVKAFYEIMKEDGEEVDPEIIGNLNAIEAPETAPIVRI
jgi:hypothetical protein